MSIKNNLKITGNHNTVYQNIDNSKIDIYLSNGTPIDSTPDKNDPLPLRIADWLIDVPTKINDMITEAGKPTDNSLSSGIFSTFIIIILWFIVLSIAIVTSKPLSWIAIICSFSSICYYLYLDIHKHRDINIYFYFQQFSILLIMSLFNSNFSKDMFIYNQHTAIKLYDLNSFIAGLKANILFWWNTFSSIISSFKNPSIQNTARITSTQITGIVMLISVVVYLNKSLRLLALKAKVDLLSTVMSFIFAVFPIGIILIAPNIATFINHLVFLIRQIHF